MWMMGYNDSGDFNMPDSFNGHKLRSLIPRPVASTNNPSTGTIPCLGRIHGTDFFGLNHHLGSHFGEQNKRELNTPPVVVSSRWNPTPEQLRTLEELYRRGTRTPSADQIQHITAQLRRYGKIEGKNVFYWFQNHKARERQKRRRQMESAVDNHHHHHHHQHHHEHNNIHDIENFERNNKDHPAASKTGYEVEQTKNWAAPTNCSTLVEVSDLSTLYTFYRNGRPDNEKTMLTLSAKVASMAERRQGSSGWIQFDEAGEMQHRSNKSSIEMNATWHLMQLSCPSPPRHLTNTNSNSITITKANRDIHQSTTAATIRAATDQKQRIKTHGLNFVFSPYKENGHGFNYLNSSDIVGCDHEENDCGGESDQTLQLFPLQSGSDDGGTGNNSDKLTADLSVAAAIDANLPPCRFFEFLPLKN